MIREYTVAPLRLVASLLVMASCIVGLTARWVIAAPEEDQPTDRKIAAMVNDQPIYEDQLRPELEKNLSALMKRGMRKDDGSIARRLRANILEKAIGDVLINQECKKWDVENLDEKVEQRIGELEQKYGVGPGMDRYLKIRRITMDDLRESLKGRVRMDEYLKSQGVLEPEIPESKIREMYDSDPGSFARKESVRVSHILIGADANAPSEVKEQAKQKAEGIRQEVVSGKDFAELAKAHSTCRSAASGGDLGPIKKGFMPPEFDAVAYTLEEGAVSDVVETKFGFHIIKVVEKSPAGVVPYEQMRGFLEKYLQGEEAKVKLNSHILELRKKSKIEIMPE